MDGIEELVVHSAVDDVDRAVAMGRTHPYLSTGAHQVTALDELDAHHPSEQRMFVVGGLKTPGVRTTTVGSVAPSAPRHTGREAASAGSCRPGGCASC